MGKFVFFKHPNTLNDAILLATEFESVNMSIVNVKSQVKESKENCYGRCLKADLIKLLNL